MIRRTWIGRLLCLLGLHRYEWRTTSRYENGLTLVLSDQYKCRRISCPQSRLWHSANVAERRPW